MSGPFFVVLDSSIERWDRYGVMGNSGTFSIDTDLVRRLVADQFPGLAHLPVTPVEPGGWDNRTFRLGNDVLARLPSAAIYVPQVEKEHRWLPILGPQLPLPVPVPIAKGRPADDFPWPWSVYRWLDGHPTTVELIRDLPEFARSLARFLGELHRIDTTGGPRADNSNFHRGGRLAVYDGETRAALSVLAGRVDFARASAVWDAALASTWRGPPLWVHGDVATGNLLVRDGKLCAVIDFGSSAIGDPACDLVIAWTLFSGESRDVFRAALPFDDDTWARTRGWALWKAVITASCHDGNQRDGRDVWHVIDEVIADHRRTFG